MRTDISKADKTGSFPVVAVGASAGGLEAFTQLLRALPNSTGMAFVLIQHLDPKHSSMLSEILAKTSSMPVIEAKDGTQVEPNHVYVIPPNVNMGILRRRLRLTPRTAEPGPPAPVDFFMRSLAEARNSRSIGVVLSGTASDGTRGLAAIKAEGGITFAQDEKSAKYNGMPHSAAASGCVDFILPPEKIAQELARISGHVYLSPDHHKIHAAGGKKEKEKDNDENLEKVFMLLRNNCGINFREYKSGTIQRRTLRRMMLHKIDHVSDYGRYLEKHPSETEALCQDLLIPVTSFFRDLEAFEALKSKVFPSIVKDKTSKGTIRIWAPGCSTGEETYSLAIVLLEFLGDRASSLQIQLFGTDVNERGIEKARAGIYQERIAQEIAPDRLRRFFTKVDEGYRVSKAVRDLCVFAKQNLAEDPPFSQMNLVACRNLLIYLGPGLQSKIMPILHYALRPSGFLMLGNAESVAAFPNLFAPADKKHKIFAKKTVGARLHYDFSANRYPRETTIPTESKEQRGILMESDKQNEADRIVLKRFAPPGVIINENMEILQFRGPIAPYIEPAPGRASLHLLKIAKREFVAELRTAVNQAKKSQVLVKRQSVEFKRNGQLKSVDISVEPLDSGGGSHQYLVLFERTSTSATPEKKTARKLRDTGRIAKGALAQMRRRLTATEEHLRSVIESKEASDEEYQSANEEILSANEELQSTNEELETSKEELQSANEELNTVNDELHNRNIDLDRVNSDLNNVLASTSMPVVMVDRGLRIRRLTAASAKVLKILPSDIGRPIMDIRSDIILPNLDELIASVLDTLSPKELEVQDKENHWYSLQIRPYRTTDDKIDGAVLILSDIDLLKRLNERLQKSKEFTEDILDTVREPLAVLAKDLKVMYVNPSFLKTFRVTRADTEGKPFYSLGNEQWNIMQLRTALEHVISNETPLSDFEVAHDFPGLGRKTMLLNARHIVDGHRDEQTMLLAIEDITERRRAQQALRESEDRFRTLFDLGPVAVYSCDASGVIQNFNRRAAELWDREPALGDTDERFCGSFKLFRPDGSFMPHEQCPMAEVVSGKIQEARDAEVLIERPDGTRVTVVVNIRPLKNERGEVTGAINCFYDITERKQAERAVTSLATIVESSEDAIISKDLTGIITSWNRGAERLFGYTAREAIGQPIMMLIPADRQAEELDILERLRRGESVNHFETVRVRKDGSPLDVSLTISPLKDSAGRVTGASKIARDITERKTMETSLRESEERFRLLADTIPQLAWMADSAGSVFWYNQGWYTYTGTTPKEVEGWGWQSAHDPAELPKVLERWRESIATGKPFEMVFPLRGADGAFRSFLTRSAPMLDSDGKVVRWFGTNTDITEQQNTESALENRVKERTSELDIRNDQVLRQSKQLQELSVRLMRSQDEQARKISRELHDSLGQYLAHVKMGLPGLKRPDATEKETQTFSHLMDTVEKCLTETRTISHLLHPPLLDEIGFSSAAKWYVEGFSERSGIKTTLSIPGELNRLPDVLELALFRILQESLTNVHRYSNSPSVEIRVELTDDEIELQVRDHGQGISVELLERFKMNGGGTGVGLRGMRERINELGGQFEIQSDKNGTLIKASAPLSSLAAK